MCNPNMENHSVAGLCTTDSNFPLFLWDKLVHQAYITINLLQASHLNPKLSAYAQIHGSFTFNHTPLAPPGTKVVIYIKPDKQKSWDPHGNTGWYIGPAMEYYRCYHIYVPKTQAYQIANTVEFFPEKSPCPNYPQPMLPSTLPKTYSQHYRIPAQQDPFTLWAMPN